MTLIEPGMRAPSFSLVDQHGERHSLSDYRGRYLVLYFYPKDETPDCTIQACQFRDHHPDFAKLGAAVLGVSPDDEASHAAFAANHRLSFPLLVDVTKDPDTGPAVSAAYGAWRMKTLFGRKYPGVVRTTYLIDRDGYVRRRWDRVRVTGHALDVLATLKLLRSTDRNGRPAKKGTRIATPKGPRAAGTRAEIPKKAASRRARVRVQRPGKTRGKTAKVTRPAGARGSR